MSIILRDYQAVAADAIEAQWREHRSTLCVLPTGCGKTVLFAEIIRRRQPGRALVIAHREELIYQARQKIESGTGLPCEIEMADQTASTSLFHAEPVVIASVQTLVSGRETRRMERFKPGDFSTIVIDEFHHATATTYRKVMDYFLQNPETKLLGVTATPDRGDREALAQVCGSVAFEYKLIDAIREGWLVPIEQQRVKIEGLDFSAVSTTAGDLNGPELARVMEQEKNLHGLCSASLEIAGDRQTIIFATSVDHAERICNILNRHRDGIAEWVCGATERDERRKIIGNLLSGKTQILCNVGVATEGFDAPGVEVIIMGRPTKSRALYAQMAGRATRPLPGVVDGPETADARKEAITASRKKSCLLVDFVGNSGRHKLVTGADLLGGSYSDEVQRLAEREMQKARGPVNIGNAFDEAERELQEQRRLVSEQQRAEEEARRKRIVARATFNARRVNPFDTYDVDAVLRGPALTGKSLSVKQRAILLKAGFDPDAMSYRKAKETLDEQFRRWNLGLCTVRQATLLQRYGFDTTDLGMDEAKQLINRIATNRWRLPADIAPQRSDPPASLREAVRAGIEEGGWQ